MKISTLFNPAYGIIRSIITLLLGLAIVIWPDIAVNLFVRILGAVMLLVGGVSLAINFTGKERLGSLFAMSGIISAVFGVILLVFPDFFVNLVSYLFGVLMIFFSIGQIVTLISAGKYAKVKFTYYIIPILIFIGGVVMLINPYNAVSTIFIVFGIALILYAVMEFLLAVKFGKLFKEAEAAAAREEAKAEAIDVEVIESKVLPQEEPAIEPEAVEEEAEEDVPGHNTDPDD